jgi:hypothetical protein
LVDPIEDVDAAQMGIVHAQFVMCNKADLLGESTTDSFDADENENERNAASLAIFREYPHG